MNTLQAFLMKQILQSLDIYGKNKNETYGEYFLRKNGGLRKAKGIVKDSEIEKMTEEQLKTQILKQSEIAIQDEIKRLSENELRVKLNHINSALTYSTLQKMKPQQLKQAILENSKEKTKKQIEKYKKTTLINTLRNSNNFLERKISVELLLEDTVMMKNMMGYLPPSQSSFSGKLQISEKKVEGKIAGDKAGDKNVVLDTIVIEPTTEIKKSLKDPYYSYSSEEDEEEQEEEDEEEYGDDENQPQNQSQEKKYIVMFVGNASSCRGPGVFLDAAILARETGQTVIISDYPGVGLSEIKQNGKNITPTMADLVNAGDLQIEKLLEQGVKPENISILGHSFGGAVATKLGARHCDQGVKSFNDRSFSSIKNLLTAIFVKRNEDGSCGKWWNFVSFIVGGLLRLVGDMDITEDNKKIPPSHKGNLVSYTDEIIKYDGSTEFLQREQRNQYTKALEQWQNIFKGYRDEVLKKYYSLGKEEETESDKLTKLKEELNKSFDLLKKESDRVSKKSSVLSGNDKVKHNDGLWLHDNLLQKMIAFFNKTPEELSLCEACWNSSMKKGNGNKIELSSEQESQEAAKQYVNKIVEKLGYKIDPNNNSAFIEIENKEKIEEEKTEKNENKNTEKNDDESKKEEIKKTSQMQKIINESDKKNETLLEQDKDNGNKIMWMKKAEELLKQKELSDRDNTNKETNNTDKSENKVTNKGF